MNYINTLIQALYTQGWSDLIYDITGIAAYLFELAFYIWYRKKYHISIKHTIIILCAVFIIGYHYLGRFIAWTEHGFSNWGANNIVRTYVYLPILHLALAKVFKLNTAKVNDFLAPGMALFHSICHLGCPFVGCCQGYESSWGIWHPPTHNILFPNQWIESLVSLSIFIVLIKRAKSRNYQETGKLYPLFLMLYGSTRFFLEFLRDNDKLLLGISGLALHAVFSALVGAIWYYILIRKEKKAAAPETT